MPTSRTTIVSSAVLRTELRMLQARYNHGAVPPAVQAVVRQLECEVAWSSSRSLPGAWVTLGDAADKYTRRLAALRNQQPPKQRWRRLHRD
jgi:hypothetical protein